MIQVFKLISELLIWLREFKDKQKRLDRRKRLKEAVNEARNNKDTQLLEHFFNPDNTVDFAKRMWTPAERERVLEQMQSTNKHKAVGSESEKKRDN